MVVSGHCYEKQCANIEAIIQLLKKYWIFINNITTHSLVQSSSSFDIKNKGITWQKKVH